MRALAQLLVDWPSLKSLTLRGYVVGPRCLGETIQALPDHPLYDLDTLVLIDMKLPDATLLFLCGNALSTLTSLTLESREYLVSSFAPPSRNSHLRSSTS